MTNRERRQALGHGLPRCLNGLTKLQRPLYLNRQRRRLFLDSDFVRARIGDSAPETGRPGQQDSWRMLAFYGSPENRRELWNLHRDLPEPDPKYTNPRRTTKGRSSTAPPTPPSLELNVLRHYIEVNSAESKNPASTRSSSRSDHARLEQAATQVRQYLDDWESLGEDVRVRTIREVFSLATIFDDWEMIKDARRRVPELEEEFAEIQPKDDAAETGRRQKDDAKQQWQDACQSLNELALRAGGPPAEPRVLADIQATLSALEELAPQLQQELDAQAVAEELRAVAVGFLAEIESNPSCEAIDPEELATLKGRWLGLTVDSIDARRQQERLRASFSPSLKAVEKANVEHRDAEDLLDEMRESRPSERRARLAWENLRNKRRDAASRLWRDRETAQDALLQVLAPPFGPSHSEGSESRERTPEDPDAHSFEAPRVTRPIDPDPAESELASEEEDGQDREVSETTTIDDSETSDRVDDPAREPVAAKLIPKVAPAAAFTSPKGVTPTAQALEPPVDEAAETLEQNRAEAAQLAPSASADAGAANHETKTKAACQGDETAGRARVALAQALCDAPPRLAYAVQLCRLLNESAIDAGQPRLPLLEAALYASRLRRPNGELASRLKGAVARALQAPSVADRGATEENVEALIGLAGTLVPALLAPYSGAAAYLQDLTHQGLDSLYRFASGVSGRSWEAQKAQVDAATFLRTARDQTTRKDAISHLLRELQNWSQETAPRLVLRYTPGNKVWHALRSKTGELGQLIAAISSEGSPRRVRSLLDVLEDESNLRKIVDRLSGELLSARQSIDTKNFKQLRKHLSEPIDLAHRYLALDVVHASSSDHRRRVIDDLVGAVRSEAPELRQELVGMAADPAQDPLVVAAAATAARALRLAERLLDPQVPYDREEPEPTQLLASGLLPFPQLRVDEDGYSEDDPKIALDVLLSSEPATPTDALARNLEIGDLATSERIISWMEVENEEEAVFEAARGRLDDGRRELLQSLREELEGVRDHLELAFLQGHVGPDRRSAHDAQLCSIEDTLRQEKMVRIDLGRHDLDRIRKALETAAEARRREVLEAARNRFPDCDDPRRRGIEKHIDDGDLVAANELLYRPRNDTAAPAQRAAETEVLDSYLRIGREQLGQLARSWRDLRAAAGKGNRVGELRFDRLDAGEQASATAVLDAWTTLKRCRPGDRAGIEQRTCELMTSVGFLDATVELEQARAGFVALQLEATPLRNRTDCPVPHFGSEAGGRYRLLLFHDLTAAEQMPQRLEQHHDRQATIAICLARLGERTHRRLTRMSREQSHSLVTLDESLLVFLAAQSDSRLAAFFACGLPFTYNQPFARTSGEVPPEMFFGREKEAGEVAHFRGSCFLYGGRQLGKTALLRHVERDYANVEQGRFAAWIDLKAEGIGDEDTADIWIVIWRTLRRLGAIDESVKRPTRNAGSVHTFMDALHESFNPHSGKTLLLLFDEADSFLELDALNSSRETFAESSRLKSLMDRDHSIKVVFAGLHNVLRTTTQSNHPLAHLGRPIQIGPFVEPGERHHAEQLLRQPLKACGYRFEPERLVRSVLARTNYYPSLLQLYGAALVNRLSEAGGPGDFPAQAIGSELLDTIHRSRELREEVRQRFEWTLQLDSRYEVIAYSMALECREQEDLLRGGIEDDIIYRRAREWWQDGFDQSGREIDRFRALLDEMVELGVLRQMEPPGRRYSLRNPNVLTLLGTESDMLNKLDVLSEAPSPRKLGPWEIRRRQGDRGPLHRPLTLWQERQVTGQIDVRHRLGRRRNAVVLVSGLMAAGIRSAAEFLKEGHGPGEIVNLGRAGSVVEFERELKRRLDKREHETTVFVVPAGIWDETWIDATLSRLSKLRSLEKYARVAFTLEPERMMSLRARIDSWLTLGAVDSVRLRPWSLDFASRWLDEDHEVGPRLSNREKRELADRTGGWPVLLELVIRHLHDSGSHSVLLEAGGYETLLLENTGELRSAFSLDQANIAATLRFLEEHGFATLDGLLDPEVRGLVDCDLSDDDLQLAFWAAEKLHLVQPASETEWRVDPAVLPVLHLKAG